MTANLQDRIEREARFTSDVSHELRSPLTTLSATVGVLEGHRDELGPRARSALDLLDGDLQRFTRMVDDLLEISRFDAGSAELSLDEVDPGELVRQAVAASVPTERERTPGSGHHPGGGRPRTWRVSGSGWTSAGSSGSWPTCSRTPSLYAGGVTRVLVDRDPHDPDDTRPPRASGSSSRTTDRGSRWPSATTSSSASTGAAGPASGRRATAPASGCPWWPSTCGCTAARCGSRTPPAAGPGSSSSCRSPPTTRHGACRDPSAAAGLRPPPC